MMNEQNELLPSEHQETQAQEEYICMDTHACEIKTEDEHIILPESASTLTSASKKKKVPLRAVVFGIVGLIVLAVAGLAGFVYTHASTDKNVEAITKRLPFPALMVGRSFVTYGMYYEERDTLTKYFASQQAGLAKPTDDQFNQLVIDTLTNKAVVQTLASNYGIALDSSKVDAFYQNIVKSVQGEDVFKKQLQDTFGWSPADFKYRIVEPVVLSQQVSDAIIANKTLQQTKRDVIDEARAKIVSGQDFVKVADDVHAKEKVTLKSDLGFIKTSELPVSWVDKVKNLEKGKISDVIDLQQGYAVFLLSDRTGKDKDEQLHLFAMTVPKVSLQGVIADYLKNAPVRKWIKV